MSKIIDRIAEYIEKKGISLNSFDKSMGLSNGYIGKQIRNKASIGSDVIEKISRTYKDLNIEWLVTGKGDMIKQRAYPNAETPKHIVEEEAKSLCNLCREKDKVIAVQREQIKVQAEYIETLKRLTNK